MSLPQPPPLLNLSSSKKNPQAEFDSYLKEKKIHEIFVKSVQGLLADKPENPYEYLIEHLIETYPEQTKKFASVKIGKKQRTRKNHHHKKNQEEDSLLEKENDVVYDDVPVSGNNNNHPTESTIITSNNNSRKNSVTQRRGSISDAPLSALEMASAWIVHEKSHEAKAKLAQILQKNWLTSSLSQEQAARVIDAMDVVSYKKGEVMIQKGDEKAEHYFMVKSGVAHVLDADGNLLRVCNEGDGFGELALMYNKPRNASVVAASEEACCYRLDRITFKKIIVLSAMERRQKYKTFLGKINLFQSLLSEREMLNLCDVLQSQTFRSGDEICVQNEPGETFYLILSGTTEVFHNGQLVDTLKEGDYFGEIALLTADGKRKTTVKVNSEEVRVAFLSKDVFKRVISAQMIEQMKARIPSYKRAG